MAATLAMTASMFSVLPPDQALNTYWLNCWPIASTLLSYCTPSFGKNETSIGYAGISMQLSKQTAAELLIKRPRLRQIKTGLREPNVHIANVDENFCREIFARIGIGEVHVFVFVVNCVHNRLDRFGVAGAAIESAAQNIVPLVSVGF